MLMPKSLNRLPTDIDWIRRVEALCQAAATELGCGVVMVAIQEDGKMLMCDAGGTGRVRQMLDAKASEVFMSLARASFMAETADAAENKERGSPH